ncbi:LysR family transcriptional regulator [Methylotuvimicrobium buryatense]|uniref:LysR family transcriptional regulator n=1 Tax=Methylotuvimicrobium buryatense TaxID=95641 RepID=A0A4P9UNU7_METBY|nr:LysR family transcriptional regulator [Methylotuvimicrobium buryatense]QCW83062.1 LysR family transcriptional regulator [Methylotuvimicrobium buryatense]
MEMHQIRYFLAVCDKGTFTRAAQAVYVSQPSMTQAIKKLEEEMGGELFVRDRGGCHLTALGRLVEPNLRRIFLEAQAIKAEAIRFTRLNTVPIRVGMMNTVGSQSLSPVFADFQRDFPRIELELIVDTESNLLRQLDAGYLDLVISAPIALPVRPFQSLLLYRERYVVAFSNQHRFKQMQNIDLKTLQSEPYLDRLNCELREKLKSVCRDLHIDLYAAYRSNSEEWILNMVRAGMGVALMPEFSVPKDTGLVDYRNLIEPEIVRDIHAIFQTQVSPKPERQALIAKLQQGF